MEYVTSTAAHNVTGRVYSWTKKDAKVVAYRKCLFGACIWTWLSILYEDFSLRKYLALQNATVQGN